MLLSSGLWGKLADKYGRKTVGQLLVLSCRPLIGVILYQLCACQLTFTSFFSPPKCHCILFGHISDHTWIAFDNLLHKYYEYIKWSPTCVACTWCNELGLMNTLLDFRLGSRVQYAQVLPSGRLTTLSKVVHTHMPLSPTSINSYRSQGSDAGKVTVGLVPHWPCITDLSG